MRKIIILVVAVVQSLISLAQPPNDDPCGAIFLTVQTGTTCTPANPFSWTGATASAGIPAPGCATYLTGDIWYFFVAPASGKVNIITTEGTGTGAITDGGMAVYSPSGPCSGSFTLVACDDDNGPGNMPFLSLSGLTSGSAYYIRFWDFNDVISGNIGGICVTDPSPPLVTSGGVGIGIQNPDGLLDINGAIKIRGGVPGLNKVLTSDANGLANWIPPFNPVPFKATLSSSLTIPIGTTNINFNAEEYDAGSNFSAGVFTSPAAGIYHFDVLVNWNISTPLSGFSTLILYIIPSGADLPHYAANTMNPGFFGAFAQTISVDIALATSQTVRIAVWQGSGSSLNISGNTGFEKLSYFDGHRIN